MRVSDIEPGLVGGTEFSQVRFHGDADRAAKVYRATQALSADDIAEAVAWVVSCRARQHQPDRDHADMPGAGANGDQAGRTTGLTGGGISPRIGRKQMQNMTDLFLHFLKDMYYAEQQMLKSLPQLTRAAQNQALSTTLSAQAEAARRHVQMLESVFQSLGARAEGVTCDALLGLLKESEDLLKETGKAGPVQDAGLIACLQAMQHYAIARYGTLLAWATEAGQQQVVTQLRQVLDGANRPTPRSTNSPRGT